MHPPFGGCTHLPGVPSSLRGAPISWGLHTFLGTAPISWCSPIFRDCTHFWGVRISWGLHPSLGLHPSPEDCTHFQGLHLSVSWGAPISLGSAPISWGAPHPSLGTAPILGTCTSPGAHPCPGVPPSLGSSPSPSPPLPMGPTAPPWALRGHPRLLSCPSRGVPVSPHAAPGAFWVAAGTRRCCPRVPAASCGARPSVHRRLPRRGVAGVRRDIFSCGTHDSPLGDVIYNA